MELTKQQINITKGIAILFMLLLHLFCTKQYEGIFKPIILIGQVPLVYYLALFGDCCVAIYCFCSGYGLYYSYNNSRESYKINNRIRIFKLYINAWVILFIFVVFIGSLTGKFSIVGDGFKDFILTITLISPAYNGAWWFLTTYIILVVFSGLIFRVIDKYSRKVTLSISFIIYVIAYIQRIRGFIVVDNEIISWVIRQGTLFGTSQLPFILGGVFAKYKIYSNIQRNFNKIKYKNWICLGIITAMIIFHGFIETLFIVVFTGIIFICVFNIMDKPKRVVSCLEYFSEHSTNLWLMHMFIYMTYFKELVFKLKFSPLIFLWLIILSLGISHCIKFIYEPLINYLDIRIL